MLALTRCPFSVPLRRAARKGCARGSSVPRRNARVGTFNEGLDIGLDNPLPSSSAAWSCRARQDPQHRDAELTALSTRLLVTPEPGNAMTPFGRRFSSSSLRRNG